MFRRSFFLALTFFIFAVPFLNAVCEEGQIDINTASLEELDALSGIGPVYAQAIIDSRPFDSVDKLIDVKGIGPVTLEKIKSQGLACVSSEDTSSETKEKALENSTGISQQEVSTIKGETQVEKIELQKISLNSKDIKTEESNEKISAETYAFYGLIAFGMLMGFLLLRGNNNKNEFR